MRQLQALILLAIVITLSSCRKDFETVPSQQGNLVFSKNTVYLDTVFTNISSSTYTLKVYNRTNKDIRIPSIHLKKADSKYRLLVDGMTGVDADQNGIGDGKAFNNVELLAKDSLYIFIETTANVADANPTDFLYTDEIDFESINGVQKVDLVTLIQDAVFLYPEKYSDGSKETLHLGTDAAGASVDVIGFELNESDPIHGNELHFTNEKPYVIYGYAGVPDGKILTIDPGTKVYFHAESGMIVQPGGSLQINGGVSANPDHPQQNEVTFEGDRLEPFYEDVPGQWGTVWLREGSVNNKIEHLTLKNATVGLLVESCPLEINHSQLYNFSNYGILARTAGILSQNLVINLAGQATLACSIGGSYDFRNCTFNNNWNGSDQRAVVLSNYEDNGNGTASAADLIKANFYNCIIYGANNIELLLDKVDDKLFQFDLKNCLVKFRDEGTALVTNTLYDVIRETNTNGNLINKDPKFQNANANKLNIEADSPAASAGGNFGVTVDVNGKTRTSFDIGAYQSAPFPN